MTLGEEIKNCRKKLNITQKEMSKILEITQSTISLYENDIVIPNAIDMKKLQIFFNVDIYKYIEI